MELAGLIAGSGWSSGVNLYAVVALLGLLGRYGDAPVPEGLTGPVVIAVAVALYAVEFVADKVPYVDNLWDAVHTVIRPVGAGVLGYLLAGEVDSMQQFTAASGSGGLALLSHSAKATARAAINTSPEPASNIVVSLAEDGLVAAVVWFAVEHPVIALGAVALLVVAGIALMVTLFGAARRGVQRLRQRRGGRPARP